MGHAGGADGERDTVEVKAALAEGVELIGCEGDGEWEPLTVDVDVDVDVDVGVGVMLLDGWDGDSLIEMEIISFSSSLSSPLVASCSRQRFSADKAGNKKPQDDKNWLLILQYIDDLFSQLFAKTTTKSKNSTRFLAIFSSRQK
jgi:hypothetical protein